MSKPIPDLWFNKPKLKQIMAIRKGDIEIIAYEKSNGDLAISLFGIKHDELKKDMFSAIVLHVSLLLDLTNEMIKE